jgi:hypothetical protein
MRRLVGKRMIVSKQDMTILAESSSSMEKREGQWNIYWKKVRGGIEAVWGSPIAKLLSGMCSALIHCLPSAKPSLRVCLGLPLNMYVPAG